MPQIDTSAEAVERLAAEATSEARDVDVAATLRALVVERMRARDEVAGWAGVAAGKDDVIHKLKADLDHLAAICRDLIKAGNDWESRLLQVEDDIVGTYHPEFGTFWRDDGEGYRLLQQARREGMERALAVLFDEPVPEDGLTFEGVINRDEKMIATIRAAAKEGSDE